MSERFETYIKDKDKRFVVVDSAEHGLGVLKGITKTKATIFFENAIIEYNMPDSYIEGEWIPIDDNIDMRIHQSLAMAQIGESGYSFTSRNIPTPDSYFNELKKEFNIKKPGKRHYHMGKKYDKFVNHSLFGTGVGDIDVNDPRDMVDIVAFLAMPGVHLIADVPPTKEDEFMEMFPDCPHHCKLGSKSNGTVKTSCQFTLNIPSAEKIPFLLGKEVMPSDTDKIGKDTFVRIIRTGFTFDLAENYGFKFEQDQDIEEIRSHIPNEYKELFDSRLEDYGYELEEDFIR